MTCESVTKDECVIYVQRHYLFETSKSKGKKQSISFKNIIKLFKLVRSTSHPLLLLLHPPPPLFLKKISPPLLLLLLLLRQSNILLGKLGHYYKNNI